MVYSTAISSSDHFGFFDFSSTGSVSSADEHHANLFRPPGVFTFLFLFVDFLPVCGSSSVEEESESDGGGGGELAPTLRQDPGVSITSGWRPGLFLGVFFLGVVAESSAPSQVIFGFLFLDFLEPKLGSGESGSEKSALTPYFFCRSASVSSSFLAVLALCNIPCSIFLCRSEQGR